MCSVFVMRGFQFYARHGQESAAPSLYSCLIPISFQNETVVLLVCGLHIAQLHREKLEGILNPVDLLGYQSRVQCSTSSVGEASQECRSIEGLEYSSVGKTI